MKFANISDILHVQDLIILDSNSNIKKFYEVLSTDRKTIFLILDGYKQEFDKRFYDNKNILIKKFNWNIFKQKHYYKYLSDIDSLNKIENFLSELTKENIKITKFIKNLYQDERIENAFKKEGLKYLKKQNEVNRIFEKIKLINPKVNLLNKGEKFYKNDFNLFISKIKNTLLFMIYPLYALFFLRFSKVKKSNKSLAIRVFNNGFRFESFDYNLDWVKKEKWINEKNMLFVIEESLDDKFLTLFKKKSYNYTFSSKKKPLGRFHLNIFYDFLKLFIFSFFQVVNFSKSPILYQKILLNAWMNYFIWNNFLSLFDPRVYLSYHDYLDNHVYRNILLNKKRCKCIMYKHTNSERVFDTKEKYFNINFAFDCHDLEIHWTKESIEMSKLNHSQSKDFLLSSPLWSSEEFSTQNIISNDLQLKEKVKEKKIISAFTAALETYGSFNNLEAHISFLNLLQKILEEREDVYIFFKPKYNIELIKNFIDLELIINKLFKTNKFFLINKITSKNLISISDLTISMSFSSPTVEAISSKKKAIYVDLNNNFPNSAYKNIDNFVASSIEDALEKVNYWLLLDNEVFFDYLNKNVKQKLPLTNGNGSAEKIRSIIIDEISREKI